MLFGCRQVWAGHFPDFNPLHPHGNPAGLLRGCLADLPPHLPRLRRGQTPPAQRVRPDGGVRPPPPVGGLLDRPASGTASGHGTRGGHPGESHLRPLRFHPHHGSLLAHDPSHRRVGAPAPPERTESEGGTGGLAVDARDRGGDRRLLSGWVLPGVGLCHAVLGPHHPAGSPLGRRSLSGGSSGLCPPSSSGSPWPFPCSGPSSRPRATWPARPATATASCGGSRRSSSPTPSRPCTPTSGAVPIWPTWDISTTSGRCSWSCWLMALLALLTARPKRIRWAGAIWVILGGAALWMTLGNQGGLWKLFSFIPVLKQINNHPFRLLAVLRSFRRARGRPDAGAPSGPNAPDGASAPGSWRLSP